MSSPSLRSRLAAILAGFAFAAAASAAEIVEFYHAGLDHYFITGYAPEIQDLDSGVHQGWARTGFTFQTFDPGADALAASIPICRFYGNPERGLDSHFYSSSPDECVDVQVRFPDEWKLEATELFRVHGVDPATGKCPANTKAVYRLWNQRSDVNHRYTSELSVADAMLAKGYVIEGNGDPKRPVVFCSADTPPPPPAEGTPVCTLTSSAPLPVINVPVTLTATCTNNPTTYSWINCESTTSTCTAVAPAIGTLNYGLVASNDKGPGAPVSLALNWQVAASAAPMCSVTATTTTPQLGSKLTLTANCSHTPSKFEWLGCSSLLIDVCNVLTECRGSTTSCSPVGTQSGPVYYSLVALNSAGASSKSGVPVTWRTGGVLPPPPPPPPTSTAPVCTVSASPSSPAVGTTLTLTASCTNNPTTYAWTSSNCAANGNKCTANEATPGRRSYSVRASNATATGAPASVQVTWQQPSTAAPVCTLAASPASPFVGAPLTLTATCSQSPTSYKWAGCTSSGDTCTVTSTTLGQATYSVTATNSFGESNLASKSVNWLAEPPPGESQCGRYPKVRTVNLPWGGVYTTSATDFPADGVLVARFTVPANASGLSSGFVDAAEYATGGDAYRVMSISTSACDFRGFPKSGFGNPPSDPTGATNPLGWAVGDKNPSIFFKLSTAPGTTGVRLIPGKTYYVNIQNRDAENRPSCQKSTCGVRIKMGQPK